jgi:ADP-ribose pyrophosphatase YjhB (NUDIX family)
MITYTHPDVLADGVTAGWADPETDPARIDWPARQAAIPFEIRDGRPVNPHAPTGVRYGRNEFGHWGEGLAADAIVTATTDGGQRWLLMVERGDGHGWALPGGMVEPGEDRVDAAVRELIEETGLGLPAGAERYVMLPRYVPDPRASDEAWIVTTAVCADLGRYPRPAALPAVAGADDARRAAWVRADTYSAVTAELAVRFAGTVFTAHEALLAEVLDGPGEAELALQEYIGDELAGADVADLRHLAEGYLRLVSAIEMTMADISDWDDDELTEVERLTRYIDHLSEATRGVCDLCGRVIFAPHQIIALLARPFWHPRRLAGVVVDFWRGLRYGDYRRAHADCADRRH